MSHKESLTKSSVCGSGKKYKHCCWGKGFDYEEANDDWPDYKSIPMSQEMIDILKEQRPGSSSTSTGGEPGPNDPSLLRHAGPRTAWST